MQKSVCSDYQLAMFTFTFLRLSGLFFFFFIYNTQHPFFSCSQNQWLMGFVSLFKKKKFFSFLNMKFLFLRRSYATSWDTLRLELICLFTSSVFHCIFYDAMATWESSKFKYFLFCFQIVLKTSKEAFNFEKPFFLVESSFKAVKPRYMLLRHTSVRYCIQSLPKCWYSSHFRRSLNIGYKKPLNVITLGQTKSDYI